MPYRFPHSLLPSGIAADNLLFFSYFIQKVNKLLVQPDGRRKKKTRRRSNAEAAVFGEAREAPASAWEHRSVHEIAGNLSAHINIESERWHSISAADGPPFTRTLK